MESRFEDVAALDVDPARARVYAEGWQSWSVTTALPLTDTPYRVTLPNSLVIDCHYGSAPDEGVFRGEGLLAVDPGDGGPVHVFGAASAETAASRVPVIEARPRGGRVVIASDAPVDHTEHQGGLETALARWGAAFAERAGIRLRPSPAVWCSWYQYFSEVTQDDVAENLTAMDELALPVGVVQIDDGYQAAPGDWLTSSGRFDDLPGLIGRIREHGRRAGIWIAPMVVARKSALFAAHPEWLVTDPASGNPAFAGHVLGDSCAALDLTHPGAAEYLADVLRTMRGWGVDYVKIDFVYAGALEGRRHEDVTGVEAYRHGLRLIREAIGPEAYLLGCGAPILPSVGMVDAMRVGPDIAAYWQNPSGHPSEPSQANATRNTVARAWQHGRFWINDPDCLMLRPEVERREDWARTVERYGGLRASSDRLRGLDPWGLETTRRLLTPADPTPLV
ncbi:glycoside hydrolase family 36 protein [Microbispora hainanensis]|uniref:Alpha-galactosidase n=1 Tax=Microbispora hainanensis TaxID=568844 RepID=A0A544YAV3_9ACTN|nr:glycoside hydrolase family 36 protein [Microbispora hainanensis]TQS13870.1 alpha-galactosidase [Microbispora hainanensis]